MAYCHLIEILDFVGGNTAEERTISLFVGRENNKGNKKRKSSSAKYSTPLHSRGFASTDNYSFENSEEKGTHGEEHNRSRGGELSPVQETSEVRVTRPRGKRFINRKTPRSLKFLALILIMGSLPGIDPSILSNTICKLYEYKEKCEEELLEAEKASNESQIFCRGEFDNFICWPHAEPGRMAIASCPPFFHDINATNSGFRYCQPNGSWYKEWDAVEGKHSTWRHIDDCVIFGDNSSDELAVDQSEISLLNNLKTMYTIGYAISLVCLFVALFLLTFFKKLHCTRNYIHMNLMVSFILRYIVILVKDRVLMAHYTLDGLSGISSSLDHHMLQEYCDENNSAGWVLTRCRLMITLMHYAITANYFWLLAEGLYLQMLLVFVVPENKYFAGFVVFGWGAPWVSVLIWVALRMNYEKSGCWDINEKLPIWWTIRAPIIISIVINFFIFINIIRLIVSKLKAHNMARSDMKMRLAKSTLALIPLLGIHFIVFLALTEEVADSNSVAMHLRLAFDMSISSIQGTLVSVLYCFLNNEVRCEVKRAWNLWRSHQALPRGGTNFRKNSTTVSGNHSTQMTQFYSRHSTTGAEIPLQENSIHNADSRTNSIAPRNSLSNGDARLLRNSNGASDSWNPQTNGCIVSADNNNLHTTSFITYAAKNNETNGNIETKDDVPFLAGETV